MRRRHLESVSAAPYGRCFASSVSSRSLAKRGSWGTAPSVFWYGAPGGTQGPLGKGGAAERWRVAYPIGIATRHGAKPATTRTYKSRPSPGRRTVYAFAKGPAPPTGEMKLSRSLCQQPLRLISFATSLYTREASIFEKPPKIGLLTQSTASDRGRLILCLPDLRRNQAFLLSFSCASLCAFIAAAISLSL